MSIIVRDETANAVVLTIDNNGNMAFADGTPINMLTLGGYGIIDSNGHIVHGMQSGSVSAVEGSATVSIGGATSVSTLSGRTPTLQVISNYPAWHVEGQATGQLGPGGVPIATPIYSNAYGFPEVTGSPYVGGFALFNGDSYDSNWYYSPSISTDATCTYRWI